MSTHKVYVEYNTMNNPLYQKIILTLLALKLSHCKNAECKDSNRKPNMP
jgi:hypothetical protein